MWPSLLSANSSISLSSCGPDRFLTVPIMSSPEGCFFFFNDTATTEIYTLSLHDALPIWHRGGGTGLQPCLRTPTVACEPRRSRRSDRRTRGVAWLKVKQPHYREGERGCFTLRDRKSTRLNSSHT